MFQPQPTPLAGYYGMPPNFPGYPSYSNQQQQQQQHYPQQQRIIPNSYLAGQQGGGGVGAGNSQQQGQAQGQGQALQQQHQQQQVQIGGVGGGGGGGSYGPGSGLPIAFRSIGASGAEATDVNSAASGPSTPGRPGPATTSATAALLFTSPAFNNHNSVRNSLNGAQSGAFHPSFANNHVDNTYTRQPHQLRRHIAGQHAAVATKTRRVSQQQHHQRIQHNVKMESDHEFSADLAAQEAAARDYQPNLEGPLVGDRIPSEAISHAYAQADPVYVQKTLALPQTYSHYRPVRGDGSCGWRATFFGYFEALIRSGDASLITAERDRITQFPILGHSEMIYEDMRDEVVILMNDIANALPNQAAAMDVLVQRFNDPDVANSILYYLRLLASSWLKSGDPSANDLAAFIPDGVGLHGYCQNYLELSDHEIEHIGLVILHNVLLKPCGIVLEIAYLDRTAGAEVNTYRIPGDAEGQDPSTLGPFIHLLFRPDHYDIIYPHAPPPPPPAPLDIQVHRMSAMTPSFPSNFMYSDTDMTALSLIPGMGLGSGLAPLAVPAAPSIESYSPSPQSPWMPSPFAESLPIRQQQQEQQQQQVPQLKQERSTPVLRAASAVPQSAVRQTDSVRFSVHCHPQFAVENETWKDQPFTTATFKNSHFNKAHYNNPNFQPEEYRPEDDENNYEPVRRNQRARRSH